MNKKWIVGIGLVIALGALWGVRSAGGSEVEASQPTLKEVAVSKGDIVIDFVGDGNVDREIANFAFPVAGEIESLPVQVGDLLDAGSVIASLKTGDLEAEIVAKELELESAQLSFDLQVQNQANSLTNYTYNKDDKYTKYMEAKLAYEQKSAIPDAYSQQEIDQAKATMDTALSAYENHVATAYSDGELELRQKEIAVEKARQNLLDLESQRADRVLVAKESLRIVSVGYQPGDTVSANEVVVLAELVQAPVVVVKVSEDEIVETHVGQKVYVELEAIPGSRLDGQVEKVNRVPTMDNNGIVSYEVSIRLVKEDPSILDGMTAVANFVIAEATDVLVIPNAAVDKVESIQVVHLVQPDGTTKPWEIRTGLTDGKEVEVLVGLEADDVIQYETR